jgi:hypothetical protein
MTLDDLKAELQYRIETMVWLRLALGADMSDNKIDARIISIISDYSEIFPGLTVRVTPKVDFRSIWPKIEVEVTYDNTN